VTQTQLDGGREEAAYACLVGDEFVALERELAKIDELSDQINRLQQEKRRRLGLLFTRIGGNLHEFFRLIRQVNERGLLYDD